IVTVVGGYHASAYPYSIDPSYCPNGINPRGIDFLAVGEGEETLSELVNCVRDGNLMEKRDKIRGLAYMNEGLHLTEKRKLISHDLPNIQWSDFELSHNSFDGLMINPNNGKVAVVISERGCPYACSFCSTQNVYGRSVRTKSIMGLADEVENLVRNRDVDMIVDYAPTANRDPKRIHDFADEIRKRNLTQQFSLYHLWRLEHPTTGKLMITDEILEDISQTFFGFKAGVGVESIDENDQAYIHKSHSLENLRSASRSFDKFGGMLRGFFMVTPETTRESIEASRRSELLALFDDIRVTYLVPFPGSPLYEEHKDGLITNDWSKFTSQEPVLKSNYLNEEELRNASRNITQGSLLNPHRKKRIQEKIKRFPKLAKGFGRYHEKMREYGFKTID
ncbi:MAG: hypothetical protein Q8N88_06785, partial [Nanoarchaeota archaeon]|nr:hypothetical protein [Nanoarchaeota archaeon]